jgi:hypothetical protein
MKARLAILGSIVVSAAALGGWTVSPSADASASLSDVVSTGTLVATVLHSDTKEPLAFMPVTVWSDCKGSGLFKPVLTDKNGVAVISDLPTGQYYASVRYNNTMSNVESFYIYVDTTASVMLFFNPNID